MAGEVIPFEMPKNLAEKMQGMFGSGNKDLSEGVQASYGVVSFKGKVWRVKFKGEERIVKNTDGDPVQSLLAVIVKASPNISKIYYEGAYTEGDQEAPLCFSIDGITPDAGGSKIQAKSCAACPKNVWGSKITEQGNKTKACADSRRIAIVPYPDLKNEGFGGPMLLRVPPASLQELMKYADTLDGWGLPYQAVITKITFDHELAYPKLMFSAVKALTEEEGAIILDHVHGEDVGRMLSQAPVADGAPEPTADEAVAAVTSKGPGPAPAPVQEAAPEPVKEEAPELVQEAAPEPVQEAAPKPEKQTAREANAVEADEVTTDLDGLLGKLLP